MIASVRMQLVAHERRELREGGAHEGPHQHVAGVVHPTVDARIPDSAGGRAARLSTGDCEERRGGERETRLVGDAREPAHRAVEGRGRRARDRRIHSEVDLFCVLEPAHHEGAIL